MDALFWFGGLVEVLLTLIFFLVQTWFLASVSRRLLGVPVGWPRSILVAFALTLFFSATVLLFLGAAGLDSQESVSRDPLAAVLVAGLSALWTFALGVAVLMAFEIMVPTGTLPNPFSWLRSARTHSRQAGRYTEVVRIASRHGLALGFRGLSRHARDREDRTARALRQTLEEAGVTFVKLGQMLSTRSDLLPAAYIRELSRLQSEVQPEPWDRIRQALDRELGRPAAEVFSHVDHVPLAAASVAQVHTATLGPVEPDHTRPDVVLKIQRPSALQQVSLDISIIEQLARWLERTAPWARRLGAVALARGFADSLTEELDYRVEAENTRALAHANRGEELRVPQVHEELSTERLLVMERLHGVPLGRAGEQLAALNPATRRSLARTLLRATISQLTVDGVFHADLHPGNVLLCEDGRLALLDFGSVGRLESGSRRALASLLFAIDADDERLACDALLELLDPPTRLDERRLTRELGQLMVRFRGGFGPQGGAALFGKLFTLVLDHGFAVPPQIAAAFRALAALEGTLRLLDPGFDVIAEARELGSEQLEQEFTPERLRTELSRQALTLLPTLARLPRRVDRLADALEQGTLTARVRVLADDGDRGFLTRLFQQLIVAVLAAAATIGAVLLILDDSGPSLTASLSWHSFFGFTLLFAGFVLALRAVTLAFRGSDGPGPANARERDRGH
ncbi:ubiquinone biosynthesis protein [Arthrobacter woluwensis]|uniref:ABC1 kinase family protein n=1 Tax=Arthrobacter woluwensis TaxID=156980 RepID=UPI0027886E85|nr:AarF/UbiB family protein [Arthrobacter woluwensis]MDQ0710462.1 ubiquinone biosynthesis protein [Arthrobacter woluwensis]